MLLTESEARSKWCPETRLAYGPDGKEGVAAVNRSAKTDVVRANSNCIATECAFWRWARTAHEGALQEGYCGRAGRPECID